MNDRSIGYSYMGMDSGGPLGDILGSWTPQIEPDYLHNGPYQPPLPPMESSFQSLPNSNDVPMDSRGFTDSIGEDYSQSAGVTLLDNLSSTVHYVHSADQFMTSHLYGSPPATSEWNSYMTDNNPPGYVEQLTKSHDEKRFASGVDTHRRIPCDVGGCATSFGRRQEQKRHIKAIHEGEMYSCGCCDNEKGTPFSVNRKDKLKLHQREAHGGGDPSLVACPVRQCQGQSPKHILMFSTKESLSQHIREKHPSHPNPLQYESASHAKMPPARSQRDQGKGDPSEDSMPSKSSGPKRQHVESKDPKRPRIDSPGAACSASITPSGRREVSSSRISPQARQTIAHSTPFENGSEANPGMFSSSSTLQTLGSERGDSSGGGNEDSQETLPRNPAAKTAPTPMLHSGNRQPKAKANDPTQGAPDEIFVDHVRPSDFLVLSRKIAFRDAENRLKSIFGARSQAETSCISFNASKRLIRLQGPRVVIHQIRRTLEDILKGITHREPSGLFSGMVANHHIHLPVSICRASQFLPRPNCDSGSSKKIFPLRKTDPHDDALLELWLKLLPRLPVVLMETIGKEYTASLVRQGSCEQTSHAVISIVCPMKPVVLVQEDIFCRLDEICNRALTRKSIKLQFSKGSLTTLSALGESNDTSQVSDDSDFPYFRRYWKFPGIGASIGMLCTRQTSGTLGCYIVVDGKLYLLTVKHLIEKSQHYHDNANDARQITSPALLDVDDMGHDYKAYSRLVSAEIDSALRAQCGNQYIGSNLPLPDYIRELEEKRDIVEKLLEELVNEKSKGNDFILGSIAFQSNSDSKVSTASTAILYPGLENEVRHHIDWALCTVDPSRQGANRHRYLFDLDNRPVGLFGDSIDTRGLGKCVRNTCHVKPSAEVHYVGQRTGRQDMVINPAPISVCRKVGDEAIETQEWALIAPGQNSGLAKTYNADSGAAIITTTGNMLVGMLWGKTEDGLLVFTPINDIFADIKGRLQAVHIRLASEATGESPPTPIATGNPRNVGYICRDVNEESERRRLLKLSDLQLHPAIRAQDKRPRKIIVPDSIGEFYRDVNIPSLEKLVASKSSMAPDRAISPVPSLTSSASSCSGSAPGTPSDSQTDSSSDAFSWSLKLQAGLEHPSATSKADSRDEEPPRSQEDPLSRRNLTPHLNEENEHSIHYPVDRYDGYPPKGWLCHSQEG